MRNGFSIDYKDDNNYSIGEFKDDVLNGWGAVIYQEGENDYILRGFFKNGKLNGIGITHCFTPEGPIEKTGFFKDGEHIPFEKIKETYPAHNYKWVPDYNGVDREYDVILYGEMNEEKLPKGFVAIEYKDRVYYSFYTDDGYRAGLFFFPIEDGKYNEHLYSPQFSNISKREWMYIRVAGLYLKPKKLVKKYRKNQ